MRKLVFTKSLRGIEDTCHFSGAYNLVQVSLIPHAFPLSGGGGNVYHFANAESTYGLAEYKPTFEVQMPFFAGDMRKLFVWSCLRMYERTKNVKFLSYLLSTFGYGGLSFGRGSVASGCYAVNFCVPEQNEFVLHVKNILAGRAMPVEYAPMTVEVRLYLDYEVALVVPGSRLEQLGKLFSKTSGDIVAKTRNAYLIQSDFWTNHYLDVSKGFVTIDESGYCHDNLLSIISNMETIVTAGSSWGSTDSLPGLPLGEIKSKFSYTDFCPSGVNTPDIIFELYGIV